MQDQFTPSVRWVHSSDGTRLAVRVSGAEDAQPLVLAHGYCAASGFWSAYEERLGQHFRVVVWDQRGHGRSEVPRGRDAFALERFADDLQAVLESVLAPGQRAVLVGHSLGGLTIGAWAERHREAVHTMVSGAVLINTFAGDLVAEMALFPLPRMLRWLRPLRVWLARRLWPLCGLPVGARLARPAASWLVGAERLEPGVITQVVAEGGASARTRALLARMLVRLRGVDLTALDVPTTAITGGRDRITPPIQTQRMIAALPHARTQLVTLPGIGHLAPLDRPDIVAAAITDLTATLSHEEPA